MSSRPSCHCSWIGDESFRTECTDTTRRGSLPIYQPWAFWTRVGELTGSNGAAAGGATVVPFLLLNGRHSDYWVQTILVERKGSE